MYNWENLILTITNLYGLRAIWNTSLTTRYFVGTAIISSMIYHSVEQEKHSMSGLWGTCREHHICVWIDRFFAVALGIICLCSLDLYRILSWGIPALCTLGLSEVPWILHKYFQVRWIGKYLWLEHYWYVFWHSLWHILAFHAVFLTTSYIGKQHI